MWTFRVVDTAADPGRLVAALHTAIYLAISLR